jgi:hypothetical protein
MADTQSELYAQAYGRNIMQLAQQKYSKLINSVYLRPNVKGKTFFQDQIGSWAMETKGGRNVQTPNNDPNLARRMGTMLDYHDARLLDRGDELKYISDPKSAYSIAAARSIGRQIDDVIISAATGTAKSGETGSVTAPTADSIAATASSFTLERIAAAKKSLDDNDVEEDDRFLVIDTEVLSSALQQEQISSADYAAVKALVNGEINSFMGFNWIVSTRLASASGDSTLIGLAYHRYALALAMAAQPLVKTDQRADLSYSWQIYYELNIGAVRLEEDRIVRINEG